MDSPDGNPATLLRATADRMAGLATRSTQGDWRLSGLLASRPEVVAHRPDGSTEHVAEARAGSAGWIAAFSPAVGAPLAALLHAIADGAESGSAVPDVAAAAVDLARVLAGRLPS